MGREGSKKNLCLCLALGLLGCVLMAAGDWVMIYGETAYEGNLAWLTVGAAGISAGRNAMAMVLAFPAVLCYCAALFAVKKFWKERKPRQIYTGLTAVGMLPWLCLHLFYTMILFTFAYLHRQGEDALAFSVGEAMFSQFSWIVFAAEALMLLPFVYFFYGTVTGKTVLPRAMALNNPLIIYLVLKALTLVLPDTAIRLAFVNGLMSESMFIWFVLLMIVGLRRLS